MILSLLLLLQVDANGYATCNQAEAEKGIQIEMNICAQADYLANDKLLNDQWKLTMQKMQERDAGHDYNDGRPGFAETLLQAQRAWIKYRDSHCALDGYTARGGSLERLLVSTCKSSLTVARIKELKELTVEY